jgi:hypothetical protein
VARRLLLAVAAAALLGVAAPAAHADVSWCGSGETAADRIPDAATGPQFHVIYAYPADGTDAFATEASQIASDVDKVDSWWRGQDPARTPRFDLYPFPSCSGAGSLDISVVKLSAPTAEIASSDLRFDLIRQELPPYDAGMKPVVFYDGPLDDTMLCGEGAGVPELGAGSLAVVYLRSACSDWTGAQAQLLAHEMTHEMGAPTLGAPFPHPCPADGAHVCDSDRDLMYPYQTYGSIDDVVLDYGRDDYYRHPGSWFDLSTSHWLRHLDVPQQPLQVVISGRGTVEADQPGLVCNATCTTQWDGGSVVGLDATAAAGQRFVGWKGACSGAFCSVALKGPMTVQAVFAPVVKAKPKPKPKPKPKRRKSATR